MLLDIIIFAILATFIIIKLRSILGNDYSDSSTIKKEEKKIREVNISEIGFGNIDFEKNISVNTPDLIDPSAIDKLEKLSKFITGINSKEFVQVAKKVFEIMLSSYMNKDFETIKELCSKDIFERLKSSLENDNDDVKIFNILVSIDNAMIKDIILFDDYADICVYFESQQINYAENDSKDVISGDKSSIVKISELWKFTKRFADDSKRWTLTSIENC